MGEPLIIRRRDVPLPTGGGVVPGRPQATLAEIGQILFSRRASDALGADCTLTVIGFDEETRQLTVTAVTEPPHGLEIDDCFPVHRVRRGKSAAVGAIYLSVGSLVRWLGYDPKASGNQIVDVAISEEGHSVSLILPEGALPRRRPMEKPSRLLPKRGRRRKPMQTALHSSRAAASHQPSV